MEGVEGEEEEVFSWPQGTIPRRHSVEGHRRRRGRRSASRLVTNDHHDEYDPVMNRFQVLDFHDVYGGPPRSAVPTGSVFGTTTAGGAGSSRSSNTFFDGIFRHEPPRHRSDRHRGAGEGRGGIFLDEFPRNARSNGRSKGVGRNLPGFSIPSSSSSPSSSASTAAVPEGRRPSSTAAKGAVLFTEEGFYDDIFGSEQGHVRSSKHGNERSCCRCKAKLTSKSKSKTSSSSAVSVQSSEDVQIQSDLRSNVNSRVLLAGARQRNHPEEDTLFASFASKLRPIRTVHHDSSPPSTLSSYDGGSSGRGYTWTPKIDTELSSFTDFPSSSDIRRSSPYIGTESFQRYNYMKPPCNGCDGRQHVLSESADISKDFRAMVSPSSIMGSVFSQPLLARNAAVENNIMEKVVVLQEDEGNEEASCEGSFIIEVDSNSHCVKSMRDTEGAAALDEAIAWAKEKFWSKQLASDATRPAEIEDDETAEFCSSSADVNGDSIQTDAKLNNLPPTS